MDKIGEVLAFFHKTEAQKCAHSRTDKIQMHGIVSVTAMGKKRADDSNVIRSVQQL